MGHIRMTNGVADLEVHEQYREYWAGRGFRVADAVKTTRRARTATRATRKKVSQDDS